MKRKDRKKVRMPRIDAVMVDAAGTPGEHGERSRDGKCPKCGARAEQGYGVAFGGFGPYEFCTANACDWFWKIVRRDDEE